MSRRKLKGIGLENDRPLNQYEVMKIIGYDINLVQFKHVEDYGLNDIFINGMCLLHYSANNNVGHWVLLAKDYNCITYFNPTGNNIDEHLKHIDEDFRKASDQYIPKILLMLDESNYEIRYNEFKLQDYNTNTCGRWCGYFGRCYRLGVETFGKVFMKVPLEKRDQLIIDITEPILAAKLTN